MTKKILILSIALLMSLNIFSQNTVDGYCNLEGETDHSGIEISFTRTAPSPLTYTTNTDATGYYFINVDGNAIKLVYT